MYSEKSVFQDLSQFLLRSSKVAEVQLKVPPFLKVHELLKFHEILIYLGRRFVDPPF